MCRLKCCSPVRIDKCLNKTKKTKKWSTFSRQSYTSIPIGNTQHVIYLYHVHYVGSFTQHLSFTAFTYSRNSSGLINSITHIFHRISARTTNTQAYKVTNLINTWMQKLYVKVREGRKVCDNGDAKRNRF